jgi:alcohol dehydrogenase class IV
MAQFHPPRDIYTGRGCRESVGEKAAALGGRRALLVSDPGVMSAPAAEDMRSALRSAGLTVFTYDGVTAEPTVAMVEAGIRDYRSNDCDIVVGLGGGSPMDAAKAIAVMVSAGEVSLPGFEGANKIPPGRPPLICLSTTAGTGSEVTPFSIITDQERDVKMLIASPELLPDASFSDPALGDTAPLGATIYAGLDALTHAIEAYVSRRAQPLTDDLALSAIRRISASIVAACSEEPDRAARDEMTLAAMEAGLAFANSSVALVHGMARPIGAIFHLPHGLSNAMLLGSVMDFSLEAAAERYAAIAGALGCNVAGLDATEAARLGLEKVKELTAALGTPTLRGAGADPARFEASVRKMADDALASGSPANNPRVPTADEIVQLYREVL